MKFSINYWFEKGDQIPGILYQSPPCDARKASKTHSREVCDSSRGMDQCNCFFWESGVSDNTASPHLCFVVSRYLRLKSSSQLFNAMNFKFPFSEAIERALSRSHRPEIGKVGCDSLASLYCLRGSLSMSSNFRRLTRLRSCDLCWRD